MAKKKQTRIPRRIPIRLDDDEVKRRLKGWITSTPRTMYRKYLKGKNITAREAILAHCGVCMGGFSDGRADCENPACPLYPWQPYRRNPFRDVLEQSQSRRRRRRVVTPSDTPSTDSESPERSLEADSRE